MYISPLYALPTNSTINYVKLYSSYWPSAASQLNVEIDKDYTPLGPQPPNGWQWLATGGTNSYYLASTQQTNQTVDNVNSFYLSLQWGGNATGATCPIIRKVEVGYTFNTDNI
jgi:hypothetical protein